MPTHIGIPSSVPGCKVVVMDDAACGKSKCAVAVGLAASVLQFASGTLIEAAEHPGATQFETSTLEIYRFSVVWLRKFARRQGNERRRGKEAMRRRGDATIVLGEYQWMSNGVFTSTQQYVGKDVADDGKNKVFAHHPKRRSPMPKPKDSRDRGPTSSNKGSRCRVRRRRRRPCPD